MTEIQFGWHQAEEAARLVRRPHSRLTDPASSWEAGEQVHADGTASRQRDRILEAVREHPGSTSRELARFVAVDAIDRYGVARRLPELRAAALVCEGKMRACEISGRLSLTWFPEVDSAVIATAVQRSLL